MAYTGYSSASKSANKKDTRSLLVIIIRTTCVEAIAHGRFQV